MRVPDLPMFYTRHAMGRMRWRRITKEDVRRVIAAPDHVERMDGKLRMFRNVDKRRLLVIVVLEADRIVVVTAMERS